MEFIILRRLNNRGAVLIVGLFTLALLSLLGAAATTTSRTDISINGNIRTIQESFYAAEVGLAMGEMAIDQETGNHAVGDEHSAWTEVSSLDLPNGFDHLAEKPQYTVEEKDFTPDSLVHGIGTLSGQHTYEVTAKGTGGSIKTQSILRSIFVKRFR